MTIKHMPSGLFPHFDCGFERKPVKPLVNEPCYVFCRADDAMTESVFRLVWSIDDVNMPDIKGVRVHKENDKRFFYRFDFLPFDHCAKVKYCIVGQTGDETTATKQYSFDVLRNVTFDKIAYATIGETLDICFDDGFIKPVMQISFDKDLTLRVLDSATCQGEKVNHLTRRILEDYDLYFNIQPFEISVRRNGEKVFCIDSRNKLTLYFDKDNGVHSVDINYDFVDAKAFYGFGEKFDKVNQKGLQPLCYVVEQYAHQEDKTYFPIPFFYTEKGVGLFRNTNFRTKFIIGDGKNNSLVESKSHCSRHGILFEDHIFVGSPKEQIKKYHYLTGKPVLPPKWSFGPWMSSNGWNTQTEATEQVTKMNQLSIPATVMVLEAWSDEENFYIFNDSKYEVKDGKDSFSYKDFSYDDKSKWTSPKEFTNLLEKSNLKLILWQIPVVKYDYRNNGLQLDNDEKYAIESDLVIKNDDNSPYRITENWFNHSIMPDFYNPQTRKWWFEKRKYLLTELNVAGFKTDGGEFLFDETATFNNGKTVEELHNDYPNAYLSAYHQFMDETIGKNNGITFSRAGYIGAQKYPIHWAGDQVSEFSELKGQIVAGLSLGLSGVPFWGFDIGGFAGNFPTTELYLRSTAFATFAPIMQFHSEPRYGQYYMTERDHFNNDRSPWNMAEANKDDKIIDIYRKFANIRMNLLPYLYDSAKTSCQTGRPMIAHLVYDYFDDKRVFDIEDEYLLGQDLLVAPIIYEGQKGRKVFLPKGVWQNLFDGKEYQGGNDYYFDCDLSQALVFVRNGSVLPLNINENNKVGTNDISCAINNDINKYTNLTFVNFNGKESLFADEENKIHICFDQNKVDIISCGALEKITIANVDDKLDFIVNGKKAKTEAIKIQLFDRKINGVKIELK